MARVEKFTQVTWSDSWIVDDAFLQNIAGHSIYLFISILFIFLSFFSSKVSASLPLPNLTMMKDWLISCVSHSHSITQLFRVKWFHSTWLIHLVSSDNELNNLFIVSFLFLYLFLSFPCLFRLFSYAILCHSDTTIPPRLVICLSNHRDHHPHDNCSITECPSIITSHLVFTGVRME